MTIKSYPFLAIAKKYNVDYGSVLRIADVYRTGSLAEARALESVADDFDRAILEDTKLAVSEFKGIQSGAIPFPST